MRLSFKAVYALRALFDVGYHGGGVPVQARDVSERQAIPARFLEQIFGELKRAGLVRSKRGPKGGYTLKVGPDVLTVSHVFEAVGELPRVPEARGATGDEKPLADYVCEDLMENMRVILTECTLADIMKRAEDMGIEPGFQESFVYVI